MYVWCSLSGIAAKNVGTASRSEGLWEQSFF